MSIDRHPTEDLPAFALGAVDEPGRADIAEHVERCSECARVYRELEDAMYEAAAVGAVTVEPPSDLRTRIVLRHRGARPSAAVALTDRLREVLARPVPLALPAALVLVLLVSFGIIGATRQQSDAYASALAGVAAGRVVHLAPTGVDPAARAALVIPDQGRQYLIVRLPAPPSGKAWEAWVLKPGPVAVPAGTSDAGGVFTLFLTAPLGTGDGVAITLEPAAGSAQPTTQPVLAVDRT